MMTEISEDAFIADAEAANNDISFEPKSVITAPSSSLSLIPCHLNIINTFPWMAEFIKLCHEEMVNANARSLEKLMNFYHRNVIQSVKECNSEPIITTKLKRSMSEILIFFHMSHSELKQPLESSLFLAKMSDLMALYLDMEIEASRSGIESLQNIASKITSCLFIYFGCSHVHILDTILKTKMINRDSWELSDLIFRRVLRDSPGSSIHVITYARYLLAFKLWKEITGSAEERKNIQLIAEHQLIQQPDFKEKLSSSSVLSDTFPRIPESETNITRFLLEAKYIIRDKIEMFMKAVADPKLQCDIDCQNFPSTNYSCIPDEKEDDELNWLMGDWSNKNLENDIEDSLLLNEINNSVDDKSKHGVRSVNEVEKKWKNAAIPLEDIREDGNNFKVVETEEIIKKDKSCQFESFWEGDTMDVAAEVELPSSPLDVTNIPTIKLEPQPSQSKENIVYPWDISNTNTNTNQNCNDLDSKSDFVVEKTPQQADIFDLQNKSQLFINKGQAFETCSSVEDHSSAQGIDLIHFEQVLNDSKSVDVPRTESILNEKYFPLMAKDIPFEKHNSGILCAEQNEEISSEEHNEELSLEEFNEEIHLGELNVECINQRSSAELNEERRLEEYIAGRTIRLSNVERSSEQSEETPPEKRGLVHDFTLKNDNKIYKFHVKLSSYWEKLNRRTWISLLFPLFSEQDSKTKTPRCTCFRCAQNYNIIMKNWKSAVTNLSRLPRDFSDREIFSGNFDNSVLKEMIESLETDGLKLLVWEPEMDEVFTKIEELIREKNKHSNLPLKKRKAFSFNTYVKEEKKEISYPNTPMISIAELELSKEKYRFGTMNMNHPSTCNALPPPLHYMPDYLSHPGYPDPADIKCDDLTVETNITNIPSDQNPVSRAFITSFAPEHEVQNRPKFKTPAELKEFQHLSAAEDLINFSLTSRAYYNENQEPRRENEREKKKTRQKTKSSRKRKRTL